MTLERIANRLFCNIFMAEPRDLKNYYTVGWLWVEALIDILNTPTTDELDETREEVDRLG